MAHSSAEAGGGKEAYITRWLQWSGANSKRYEAQGLGRSYLWWVDLVQQQ
jgi:hypothetical protein